MTLLKWCRLLIYWGCTWPSGRLFDPVFSFSLKPFKPAADARPPSRRSFQTKKGSSMGFITKRRLLFGVTAALLIGVVGGAYAYFTSTGAGTATATVGTSS